MLTRWPVIGILGAFVFVVPLRADVALVFEAESVVSLDGVFEFVRDPAAGGRAGLQVREGVGADYDEKQAGELQGRYPDVPFAAAAGRAAYRFHVPADGQYWVWARAYWLWECSNSFWIGDDPDSSSILTDRIYHRWHWVRAERPLSLATGTTQFTISNREDGIRIDQFCLTRDRGFRPKGVLKPNVLVPRSETPVALFLDTVAQAPQVFPETDTPVVLWVRNASAHRRAVRVSVTCDEALTVAVPEELTAEIPARSGLVDITFRVRSRDARPFRRSRVRFDVQAADGAPVSVEQELIHALPWSAAGPFRARTAFGAQAPRWWQSDQDVPAPSPDLLASLTWTPVSGPEHLTGVGRIDLRRVFGRQNRGCWALLRAEFEWPRNEELAVELRSDDQSILWLNGRFAAAHRVIGPGERYLTPCTLQLRRGSNTIIMAVNQVRAFWEACLLPARKAQ